MHLLSPLRATPPCTAEHRIGSSPSELARLEAAGGRLSRLNQYGSGPSCGTLEGMGPVRLWPGGIMVGRAIGDRDVGAILLPNPHICQVGERCCSCVGWGAGSHFGARCRVCLGHASHPACSSPFTPAGAPAAHGSAPRAGH